MPTNNEGSANTSGTRNVQDSVSPLSNKTSNNNTSNDSSISGSRHQQQQQSSSSPSVVTKIKIDDSSNKNIGTSDATAVGNSSGDKTNDELGPRRVLHFPSPESHKHHYQYQHPNHSMQRPYPQQSPPPPPQQQQQYNNKHHNEMSSNNSNSSGFNSRLDERNMNMMNQRQSQYQQRQGAQQQQLPSQSSSSPPHSSFPPPTRAPYGQQHNPYNMRYNSNNLNNTNKGSNYPMHDEDYPKQSQQHPYQQQQQNQQHYYNHPSQNHQNQFGPTPVKPNRHCASQGMQASRMAYEQQQQQQDPNQVTGGIGPNVPNRMSPPSRNPTKIDSGNSTRSSLASPPPKSMRSNHENMVNHSASAATHANTINSSISPHYNSGIGDNAVNSRDSGDKNTNRSTNNNHRRLHQELSPSMNRGDHGHLMKGSGNDNNNNSSNSNSNSNNNNSKMNSDIDNNKPKTDNLPQASPLERFKYDQHSTHPERNSNYMPVTMNSGYHSASRDHASSSGMGIGGMTIMTPCSINMTPASSTGLAGFDSAGFEDAANSFMVSPALAISKRGNSKRSPYDLHEQAFVNDPSSSPTVMRDSTSHNSATRYCTPIVTGNNDRRSRHISMSHNQNNMNQYPAVGDGDGGERNYRPSPITGGAYGGSSSGHVDTHNDSYDSHLRHYHRPYPTIRGGQSSPSRFDLESSPRQRLPGESASPQAYETPMVHRGTHSPSDRVTGASSEVPPSQSATNTSSSRQSSNMRSEPGSSSHYFDHPGASNHHPYHGPPPIGGIGGSNSYHRQPSMQNHNHPSYPKDPYHFGPPHHSQPPQMYLQSNTGFFSPYDTHGHMNSMKNSHHPNHHGPPPSHSSEHQHHHHNYGQNYSGSGNNPYHMSTDSSYSQYPHQHHPSSNSHHHIHQTPVDQPQNKRRRVEEKTKKTSSKPPRRKKMYSDFVGVTYNKTHAKYQACITHYRKQHYLGRYKLAVDAARAYDQSAKLLKGEGWKINFQADEDYEAAKAKEVAIIERRRMAADGNSGVSSEGILQYDPTSRMVKEKLGLRMPMSQDPSIVAEKMLADRLSAVAKQAADHADQLKQNGVDITKKNKTICASIRRQSSTNVTNDAKAAAKSAVTPSPNNTQHTSKPTTVLLNEPLMSPAFMESKSPSAETLLAQHSSSSQSPLTSDKPNSNATSSPNVKEKPQTKVKEDKSQQSGSSLKSGNTYISPDPKIKIELKDSDVKDKPSSKVGYNLAENNEQNEEPKKEKEEKLNQNKNGGKDSSKKGGSGGGGALAAASALLMIRH